MDWLPNELSLLSGNLEDDYGKLFEVFRRDFIETQLYFSGERVVYQEAIDRNAPGEYPHGFTHLITKKNGGQRIIDYDRATKLPWVRAIIEHSDDPSIAVIKKTQSSEKYGLTDNTYLWLESRDFLVVLRRITKGFYQGQMLITAYAITEQYERKRLYKWLEEGKNSGN